MFFGSSLDDVTHLFNCLLNILNMYCGGGTSRADLILFFCVCHIHMYRTYNAHYIGICVLNCCIKFARSRRIMFPCGQRERHDAVIQTAARLMSWQGTLTHPSWNCRERPPSSVIVCCPRAWEARFEEIACLKKLENRVPRGRISSLRQSLARLHRSSGKPRRLRGRTGNCLPWTGRSWGPPTEGMPGNRLPGQKLMIDRVASSTGVWSAGNCAGRLHLPGTSLPGIQDPGKRPSGDLPGSHSTRDVGAEEGQREVPDSCSACRAGSRRDEPPEVAGSRWTEAKGRSRRYQQSFRFPIEVRATDRIHPEPQS